MNNRRKRSCLLMTLVLITIFSAYLINSKAIVCAQLNSSEMNMAEIDKMVNDVLKESKVPGVAISIINNNKITNLSYGYADKEEKIKVDENTLFELGSLSKAYTALAITKLEQEGKLSLDDPVKKYIPNLKFLYKGKWQGQFIDTEVSLTLSNLLYHTSGIATNTIGNIPESESEDSLEKTVMMLDNTKLEFYPGTKTQYATINYDILGLIIERVTGQTYEDYICSNVLQPLNLNDTFVYKLNENDFDRLATGYKMSFFKAKPYNAPKYRGNAPAGYIISSASDMAKWMQVQMNLVGVDETLENAILKTHESNMTVQASDNFYYGGGWWIIQDQSWMKHAGENPNYSSYVCIIPKYKIGVCVLANMNSNVPEYICDSIMNMMQGNEIQPYKASIYNISDTVFSLIVLISTILGLLLAVFLIKAIVETIRKIRVFNKNSGLSLLDYAIGIFIIVYSGICIYNLPQLLFERLPWNAVNVWCSNTIQKGCISAFVLVTIFMIYVLYIFSFTKEREKNYPVVIILSCLNGISSWMLVAAINETFNRNLKYSKEYLLYYTFAIVCFVYTIRLVQGKLILYTNEIAYEKRVNIINKIMGINYEGIEKIGHERINSSLFNDTQAISQLPGLIISVASNSLTLIFCLIYLGVNSIYTLIASLVIIVVNGTISMITSRMARSYWEKNRDVQDIYYGQITDLISGFKEIMLNTFRRLAFGKDMEHYTRLSADLNRNASLKFLNFNLYSTFMYNVMFGIVVFIFPIIFLDIDANQLRTNLLIVFYLVGPFNALTGAIPQITQIRINIRRVNELTADLEKYISIDATENLKHRKQIECSNSISLELKNVVYRYTRNDENNEETQFQLGPISTEFRSGEVTFITGGNGTGKTTFAKIITGLYKPQEGSVLLRSGKLIIEDPKDYFSAVFSDFHLFKKLYGYENQDSREVLNSYLELMRMKDLVEIDEDGAFDRIQYSTGQKKRLALAISCMENKSLMLFDEWAAEQDPEYRDYFYRTILPELKKKGKGIIVITHDDRYFNTADRLLKLDNGRLVELT